MTKCQHAECAEVHVDWIELRRGERAIQAPMRFRRYQCRRDPTTGEPLEASDPDLIRQDQEDAARIWQETWGEVLPVIARPTIKQRVLVPLHLHRAEVEVLDALRGAMSREAYIGELLRRAG